MECREGVSQKAGRPVTVVTDNRSQSLHSTVNGRLSKYGKNIVALAGNQPDILDGMQKQTPIGGTPQGAVISPLSANLYLHPLDKLMKEGGFSMVRYADDFVILSRSKIQAEDALKRVREWVEADGLTLHPDKTHVGNCLITGLGFEFPGYRFEGGNRFVRKKSLKALKDKIRSKT